MGSFLKVVAGLCLIVIWTIAVLMSLVAPKNTVMEVLVQLSIIAGAIALSLPIAMVYALGSISNDMKEATGHLRAMRHYYEPQQADQTARFQDPQQRV